MAAATATAGTHDAWWCWKTFPIIRQSEQMALPDTESAINLADRTRYKQKTPTLNSCSVFSSAKQLYEEY